MKLGSYLVTSPQGEVTLTPTANWSPSDWVAYVAGTKALTPAFPPLVPTMALPPSTAARGLHYLLATPFRYGHKTSSRFRRVGQRPGIFYAAEHSATAIAETAYWRMLFFSRSPGFVPPIQAMAAGLKNIMDGSSPRAAAPARDVPCATALCSRT